MPSILTSFFHICYTVKSLSQETVSICVIICPRSFFLTHILKLFAKLQIHTRHENFLTSLARSLGIPPIDFDTASCQSANYMTVLETMMKLDMKSNFFKESWISHLTQRLSNIFPLCIVLYCFIFLSS